MSRRDSDGRAATISVDPFTRNGVDEDDDWKRAIGTSEVQGVIKKEIGIEKDWERRKMLRL